MNSKMVFYKQRNITRVLLILICPILLSGADLSPQKVIQNVEKKLQSKKAIRVVFEEKYIWKLTGESHVLAGELIMSGENQFRVTTEDQIIISNGINLWTYSKPSNRVLIDLLNESEDALLPHQIFFQYTEEYNVRSAGDEEIHNTHCIILEFTSSTGDDFIPKVRVWIDQDEWLPKKVEQEDLNGNVTQYSLNTVELISEIDSDIFEFLIPKDADVIEMQAK